MSKQIAHAANAHAAASAASAAAAAAAAAGRAARLPPPSFTAAGTACHAEWKGHGLSQHAETKDLTLWKNVRIRMTVQWNGDCIIDGCGASVLKRNCLGATQALESLAIEELIRKWRGEQEDARRFSGPSNSIKRAALSAEDAAASSAAAAAAAPAAEVRYTVSRAPAPAPDVAAAAIYRVPAGGPSSLAPYVEAANAAAMARESINIQVPHQNYPGVNRDEVAIPFLLFGRCSLKTGEIVLQKVHVKWAYNNITYQGRLSGRVVDADGVESELPLAMLLHQMDAYTRGEEFDVPIQAIRMDLQARWSSASLAFIAAPLPLPEEAAAAASVSASASASSSSSSSFPASSTAHSLASPVFSPPPAPRIRPVTPSTLVLNTPPAPLSPSPSLGQSMSSPSASSSPEPKQARSPSPTSASSSSSSSSSSSTPRLAKHDSAASQDADAARAMDYRGPANQAPADSDSNPHA